MSLTEKTGSDFTKLEVIQGVTTEGFTMKWQRLEKDSLKSGS